MIYTHDTSAPLTKEQWDYNFQQLATRYELATGTPMSVILRQNLNRALMNREVDSNFQNLDAGIRRLEYGDGPYPVLDQTFVGASFLDPRITHTRPGKSWRIVNGVLREYDVDEPVLTPDGWSLSPAETNLLVQSRDLTQAATIARADITATETRQGWILNKLTCTSSGAMYAFKAAYINAGKVTASAVVAKGNNPWHMMELWIPSGDHIARYWFNSDTEEIGFTQILGTEFSGVAPKVENLGGGLWRLHVTSTLANGATVRCFVAPSLPNNAEGNSAISDFGWCGDLQLNAGDPIPYIPTTTGAVTRPADNTSIQGAAFSEIFNPQEGAIVVDLDFTNTNNTIFDIAGSTDIGLRLLGYQSPKGVQLETRPSGVKTELMSLSASAKIGITWGDGVAYLHAAGSKSVASVDATTLASAVQWRPAFFSADRSYLYRRLTIFNRRPSDAQMEAMTS